MIDAKHRAARNLKRFGLTTLLAGLMAASLAACGGAAQPIPALPTQPPTQPPPPTPATNGSASTPGTSDTQEVPIVMKDNLFEPNTIEVTAGKVRWIVTNEGNAPHNVAFKIEGQDVLARTDFFRKGEAAPPLEMDLQPGTYKFVCEVPGHEQQGMVGQLTVK